jgi:outer membrane protein assembly factor BamB
MPDRSGSTPIVWEDNIFLNVAEGDDLYLWAVKRDDGTVRWKRELGSGNKMFRKHNMSTPSPVTDGQYVWIMTGTGVLAGFDYEGRQIWKRNIQSDYGSFGLKWGYGSSPVLFKDILLIQVLHGYYTDDASYLLAVDKATGQSLWKVDRPTEAVSESPDAYTTPGLLGYSDGRVEVVVTGGDFATGHDVDSGKEIWRLGGLNPSNGRSHRIVASAVIEGDLVFVPSRVRPLLAVRAGGRGDVTDSHLLWSFERGPDVPTPVSDGEHLYVVTDRGIMSCLSVADGSVVWGPERLAPGTYSSSPVLADGRVYATSEDGLTTVVRAAAEFEVLSQNSLDDYCLSSLAVSQGQFFIRTTGHLYCIGERKP